MLLFGGLKESQAIEAFSEISRLKSYKFQEKEFLELYRRAIGFYEDNYEEKEKTKYNFLYLISQPEPQIWSCFEKRLK